MTKVEDLRQKAQKLREEAKVLDSQADKLEEPIVKLQKKVAELEKEIAALKSRPYMQVWPWYDHYPFWTTTNRHTLIGSEYEAFNNGMSPANQVFTISSDSYAWSDQSLANRL